jgi:hypothetical protein
MLAAACAFASDFGAGEILEASSVEPLREFCGHVVGNEAIDRGVVRLTAHHPSRAAIVGIPASAARERVERDFLQEKVVAGYVDYLRETRDAAR